MNFRDGRTFLLGRGCTGHLQTSRPQCRHRPIAGGPSSLLVLSSAIQLLGVSGYATAAPHLARRTEAQTTSSGETPVTSLRLVAKEGDYQANTVTLGGQSYGRAVQQETSVLGSPSYQEYYLGKRCSRFRALVGVSDFARDNFSAVYVVLGDGQELYRSRPLRVGSEPQQIDIDVTGVLRLKLVAGIETGDCDFDSNNAFWVNPRVDEGGVAPQPTVAKIILDGNPLVTEAPLVQGEPCLPLSVLQKLKGSIRKVGWSPDRGELVIETR